MKKPLSSWFIMVELHCIGVSQIQYKLDSQVNTFFNAVNNNTKITIQICFDESN